MNSQSASQQTVIPHDELLPRDQFLPIKENNFIFCPDAICTKCPVMVEILKGHPIFKALTLSEDVPEIYIQQFWNTITYNTTVSPHKFEGMIEDVHVAFTLKQFRRMFDLKEQNDFTGKEEYDDFSPEEELCADIVRLGYEEPLPKASAFRRKHLSQVWATLFSIINRCLTSKSTGMDQCSISVLRIFQGIAFSKNYDYARLFWNDLMEVVKDKNLPSKARKFVPFLRFLKIIIFSIMRRYKDIPRRPNDPTIADFQMKYLRRDCGNSNVQEVRIPDELLAYADQTALMFVVYKELYKPLMIQPEPKGSTQGATLGSNSDPKRTQGDNIQLYSRRKKGDDVQLYNDSDDADNQDSRLNVTNIANEDSNNEGGVENEERSSEESENLFQTKSDNWVNTSTNGLHLLISSIEQDFMDPVTQALTPPSHSVASQHGPVSIARTKLAYNLLHSHSENVNIGKGGHLLSSPISLSAQSSLEPSKTMSRTLEANASLRNFAGTSVVVPNVGISRGSGGNPTSVGVNVCYGVESTVVLTEPLSGPGVSDFPEFVSREYLDGALKAVQESFDKKLADMQRLLDGKHVATEEAILPPPPPPRSQQDLSVDELKQLLLAKLLSQSEDESADANLIMILRKQSEVSLNIATKEDAMNSTKSVNATLEKLSARLAALEQSFESQAHGLKRRHDDHDPNEAGDNVMEPVTVKKRFHQHHNSNGS
ncbi:hypothetical protein Tco_1122857 [Tanacetum coccineum]|uniref:Uncharacterized protein n=1 Tax=Tanacetum coccineum TaxID=301880 RepID=A0ABQ5J1Q9_9ASTR